MHSSAGRVVEIARDLRVALKSLDPAAVPGSECAEVAQELAMTEKACGAARLLAAERAVAAGAHRGQGVADPTAWLARQAGTTGRNARQGLDLARSLRAHPETKDALLSGEVSISQAHEITKVAAELPGAERELLEVARRGDLTRLRDEARERRFASTSVADLHGRQLAARRFRHWRDGLGMICFEGALPPQTGIPLVAQLERRASRLHQAARSAGSTLRFEAYAADAFVEATMSETGAKKGRATDLVILCDVYAWRRGHAHEGELCQLLGGGPIPVEVARELADDAFLKVALHDGVDILKIHHVGRKITAHLRTALDLGPAPFFPGRACVDCERRYGLQHDHDDPIANDGPTTYANLKDRCYACHAAKTERDRSAGLLGPRAKARGPGPPGRKWIKRAGIRRASLPRRSAPRRAPPVAELT